MHVWFHTGVKVTWASDSQAPPAVMSAGCELYAFCGALFGICSMITLTVIAIDRYFVITRPLTSIGVLSRKRAFIILMTVWIYSLGWSLPPFFGWSENTRTHARARATRLKLQYHAGPARGRGRCLTEPLRDP